MRRSSHLLLAAAVFALAACDETAQRAPDDSNGGIITLPDVGPRPRVDGAAPDAGPEAGDAEAEGDAAPETDAGPCDSDSGCGTPPREGERDAADFDQVPFAIETRVGDRNTPVGLENRVTCEVLDQQGAPIPGHRTVVEIHPDSGFERTEVGVVGVIARDYRIVCTAPDLGLRDPTPAEWTVLPGPARTVVTVMDDDEIAAGGDVGITCEAFDEAGNVIPVEESGFEVRVRPPPPDLRRIGEGRYIFEKTGDYEVTCTLPGAEPAPSQALRVRPGLPARLAVGLFPDRPVYRVGSVVELVASVTDRFDNPVPDAALVFGSDPPLETFGAGRYRLRPEGRYRLIVDVPGPTQDDRVLHAEREILVDFGGPGIACEFPAPGEWIRRPEGGHLALEGRVADVAAIQRVLVDGQPVDLRPDGSWRADREAEWGLNVHDVVAVDENGNENSTFCAYFAADEYLDENQSLTDALVLRLGQGALDEGEPDRPLQSIADILRRVVNSRGLRDTVHQAALAQNPIVPNECRVDVLGVCLFRIGVEYRDLQIGGRNTLELTIVDRGLRVRASIRDLNVFAQLQGTLGNRAHISASHITIGLTFDVGRRFDGNPEVRLRSVDEVSVGDLDSDFSGFLTGFILELVFEAFEGLIRRTIVDALRDFLDDNIDSALEDLLGNLDVGALAQGFDVPSLTGGEPVRMTLQVGLSTVDFAQGRALLGIEAKMSGPARIAARSPGVPLPPGTGRPDLPADRTVGAAVGLAVLNQALHRLWRAGYFDTEVGGLVGNVAGDLPEGTEVFLSLPTPPVVIGAPNQPTIRVFLGPVTAGVVYPGLFEDAFRVYLAGELSATVRLQNERDLVFEGVDVEALHLAFGGAAVSERARNVLEDTLTRVLRSMIDRALNDGLPVIPIPTFEIPQSLGQYDLPVGRLLGLFDARLNGDAAYWKLDGNFREGQ